jgi:hypothetical protein
MSLLVTGTVVKRCDVFHEVEQAKTLARDKLFRTRSITLRS